MPGAVHTLKNTVFIILIFTAAVLVVGRLLPAGPDYFYTFRPSAELFFAGKTRLYDIEQYQFFLAPWAIFLIGITNLFPLNYGNAVLAVLTIGGQFLAIKAIAPQDKQPSLLILVLAIVNLHTIDLILRGNVDGFLSIGLALGWMGVTKRKPLLAGLGLWLLAIKPVNVLLVFLVLGCAMWKWSAKEKLLTAIPLGISILLSFPVFGFDWPVRYIHLMQANPPFDYLQTSLWRSFEFFGLGRGAAYGVCAIALAFTALVIIRSRVTNPGILSIAITTNIVFSPYTLGSHYTILAPVFVTVSKERIWLALSLWALTFTPLLRLIWGFDIAWIDSAYPLALMIGAWSQEINAARSPAAAVGSPT